MSTTDKVFSVSRHSPSPVRIVRAQMRHQGGSAGEILGRKLARSDPQPWWGREGQVGTARRSAHHLSWQRAILRYVQDCGAGS
jgi:hypothetical protein